MARRGRKKAIAELAPRARDPRDVETIERLQQRIQELEFQQLQQDSPAKETETESNVWDNGSEDVNPFGGGNPLKEPIMFVEDESCPVYDTDNEEESIPVYDTDIEDVIEEEEGFVGKGGFGEEEDNIEDYVVVANDLCSSMIQTILSVDFEKDINTKSHELMSFGKSIIIKVVYVDHVNQNELNGSVDNGNYSLGNKLGMGNSLATFCPEIVRGANLINNNIDILRAGMKHTHVAHVSTDSLGAIDDPFLNPEPFFISQLMEFDYRDPPTPNMEVSETIDMKDDCLQRSRSLARLQARKEFLKATSVAADTTFETEDPITEDFLKFITMYPNYTSSEMIDQLRVNEYLHLTDNDSKVCLDYCGFGLFSFLQVVNYWETCAISLSKITTNLSNHALYGCMEKGTVKYNIKARIMDYLNIPESKYGLVFTVSRGSAFKLLAESYPFNTNKSLLTMFDHESQSVNWMGQCAKQKGPKALSPLDMDSLGLSLFRPDFIITSFYKVFVYDPTGLRCLLIKKSVIGSLQKRSSRSSSAFSGVLTPSLSPVATDDESPEDSMWIDLGQSPIGSPSSVMPLPPPFWFTRKNRNNNVKKVEIFGVKPHSLEIQEEYEAGSSFRVHGRRVSFGLEEKK
nr:pyridoxal phosphate-dependent transferase [Tanacetum cinerariifolium]